MPISVSVIVGMLILMSYSTRQDEKKSIFFFNGVFPLVYLIFLSVLQNSIILCSNVNWFIILHHYFGSLFFNPSQHLISPFYHNYEF
jgi:hypothetical protein